MKRRIHNTTPTTAAECAALFARVQREVDAGMLDRTDPRRPAALAEALRPFGVDVVDCIRARRALRRGTRWRPGT